MEVAVVGGGVIGLTSALALNAAGYSVTVIAEAFGSLTDEPVLTSDVAGRCVTVGR